MVNIQNDYAEAVKNLIRDQDSETEILKKYLMILGEIIGQEIASKFF